MKGTDKKERLLKDKIAVALQHKYQRVPTSEEVENVLHLTRVMCKAVFGLHYKRLDQKRSGQLALF